MDPYGLIKRGNDGGLWEWNLKARRIHFSPGWITMLGCEPDEVGNAPEEWFRRIHPEDLKRVQSEVDATLAGKSSQFESQHRLLHKEGTYRWMSCRGLVSRNKKGQPIHLAGFHSDITAEKPADALTGLPNRLLFLDRLERSIERAKRCGDYLFAVLLLDIDRFGSIVERLGSRNADQLLIAVARRLETSLRAGDTVARLGPDHVVARLGGDEFTILLDSLGDVAEARSIAERLLTEFSEAFELDGQQIFLTATIGIALSLSGYIRPEDALRDADIALHRAQSVGTARCEMFDQEILNTADTRLRLENEFHEAMAQNELSLAYQPVVSLLSNRIVGFEALVRWKHPQRGVVPAADFISVAERTGLIIPLGRWVLYEACQQLKTWQARFRIPPEFWIAVNFSPLQFKQPSLVRQIGEILHDNDLDPRCLMLELTEEVLTEDPQVVGSLLMQLRVLGVRIALDDFGTGSSSLSYLRQFPVDYLKLDQSFLHRMETSKELAEITRTIGSMAHQLGLRVIAEGIENGDQLILARSLNCEYGQGHLFSKPIEGEEAAELLKTGLPAACWGEHIDGCREDTAGGAYGAAPANHPATDDESWARWPLVAQIRSRFTRRVRTAAIVSAAAVLLLAGIAVIRFAGRSSPTTIRPELRAPVTAPAPALPAQDPQNKPASPKTQTQSARDASRKSGQVNTERSGMEQRQR